MYISCHLKCVIYNADIASVCIERYEEKDRISETKGDGNDLKI